jgi:glycosyltransferase involved in cell wall biosynthesis
MGRSAAGDLTFSYNGHTQSTTMHIAINALPGAFAPFPVHITRYLSQVVAQIQKEKPSVRFSCIATEGDVSPFPAMPVIESPRPESGIRLRLSRANPVDGLLKTNQIDLVLSPLQCAFAKCAVPQVLLALDLDPWESGAISSGGSRDAKAACAAARHIIAPTEHIRRRCLELFEAPMERIVVAPPGVASGLYNPANSVIEKPYFALFYDPLTAPLLNTIRAALAKRPDEFPFTQVIVGPSLPEEPDNWGPGVVRIEQCPDSHLAGLYQQSSFFLYAGPHDGSGLRVLEALATGVPVLAAGSRGVAEVAGDAPIYFNAESLDAFFQSLKRILSEGGQARGKRITTGTQIASRYNWEKTMWKVLSTFKAG